MVGFTLVELLVAMVVVLSVFAAAVAAVVPASGSFHAVPDYADAQQRLRAAVGILRTDLLSAVSGPVVGPFAGSSAAWPTVLPCGWGWDPVSGARGPCARSDVLSVVLLERYVQVLTASDLAHPGAPIEVERPPGCGEGLAACQFEPGDHCVIADGFGAADTFDLWSVTPDGARLVPAPGTVYWPHAAHAAVSSARVRTYYIRDDPSTGALQLRRAEVRSDVPVLDHLTAFSVDFLGEPDPPVVAAGPGGEWRANYGPRPPEGEASAPFGGWPPAENCLYRREGGGLVSRLVPLHAGPDGLASLPLGMLADGPWCPDAVSPARYDADLYRIRRVRITVRVQAVSAASRGAEAGVFATPGSARSAHRRVPDVVVRFDVALRAGR